MGIKTPLRFFPVRYLENRSETKDIKFNSDNFKDTSINCEEATIIAQALYLILYYRQKLF